MKHSANSRRFFIKTSALAGVGLVIGLPKLQGEALKSITKNLPPEFINLARIGESISNYFNGHCLLIVRSIEYKLFLPSKMLEIITENGKKGLGIQRFKGLGEMNAEQLWETTLDHSKRTLLQVKVSDIDGAEEIISTLMGSVVEPRKDFINANALNVVNLDI